MQYRKLIEVLSRLNSDQISGLSDFIHSPYFNKSETNAAIFDHLKKLHPKFSEENTSSESLLKKVKGVPDEKSLTNRMQRLLELTERFLSFEYAGDPVMERIGTVKAYKKLQLPKHFESSANALRKELKNHPFRDFDHLWHIHKLEEEAFEGFDKVIVRTAENPADSVLETLRKFYLTKKLRYMADAVYRERLLGVSTDDNSKKEVKDFIEKNANESDLYLLIYGNIYLMNVEKDAEVAMRCYKQVKTVMKTFAEDIPNEEAISICVHLQNFCLTLINKGSMTALRDFFELISFRISEAILLEEGRMNPQLYKNIIGVALRLDETDWALDFANNFRENLPVKLKSDYYNVSLGQLYYHKKDYATASKYLIEASHNKSDVYFALYVKKLLLKIGFESNENPIVLESHMNAYRKHLERYRSKIGENAPLLERFFKYFRYLEKTRWNSGEMEILLNTLIEEQNFPEKDWLIKMAQSRMKKTSHKQPVSSAV